MNRLIRLDSVSIVYVVCMVRTRSKNVVDKILVQRFTQIACATKSNVSISKVDPRFKNKTDGTVVAGRRIELS